jgi:hypothetical protein
MSDPNLVAATPTEPHPSERPAIVRVHASAPDGLGTTISVDRGTFAAFVEHAGGDVQAVREGLRATSFRLCAAAVPPGSNWSETVALAYAFQVGYTGPVVARQFVRHVPRRVRAPKPLATRVL